VTLPFSCAVFPVIPGENWLFIYYLDSICKVYLTLVVSRPLENLVRRTSFRSLPRPWLLFVHDVVPLLLFEFVDLSRSVFDFLSLIAVLLLDNPLSSFFFPFLFSITNCLNLTHSNRSSYDHSTSYTMRWLIYLPVNRANGMRILTIMGLHGIFFFIMSAGLHTVRHLELI